MGSNTDGFFLSNADKENTVTGKKSKDTTDGFFLQNNDENLTRVEISQLTRQSINSTRNTRYTRDTIEFLTSEESEKDKK